MELPVVVRDVLNSLSIASLPPQVNAGDPVDLRLDPGLNAFDALFEPPILFDIKLNDISLNNIALDLTDISLGPAGALQLTLDNVTGSPGTTDLKVVSKAVEFSPLNPSTGTTATDVNTNEASLHALPHSYLNAADVPVVSTDVEGLLSKITGTVSQVESLSGGITGNVGGHIKGIISGTIKNLSGSVTSHASVTSRPHVTLEWYMEDANGKRLTENTDFVMLNKTTLTIDNTDLAIPPPSLVFLPVFAEASVGVDLITRRRIFCIVTVEVGSDKGERVLGPVDILLPKIQLPTVLVMTEKKGDGVEDPGAVLVAIPSESSLTPDLLSDKLGGVKDALERIKTLSGFTGFDQTVIQIGNIIVLINPSVRRATYVKQDQVMDLWWVSREPGFFGFGYKSWEDCINRLIMLGPPGRIARFHVAKNLWERLGAFEIELGLHAVGHINDLSETPLTCEPTEAGGCILRQRWDPPPSTFKDAISSFQFLPLQ